MTHWWLDTRLLDAGDARGLARTADRTLPDTRAASGDLSAAAALLGVDVADLVTARRRAGIAPTHRAPSLLARLAARIRKG